MLHQLQHRLRVYTQEEHQYRDRQHHAARFLFPVQRRIVANKLLALLASNVLRVVPPVAQGGGFEAVRQFIEEHLTDDISVEQLMASAKVSERSLYTLFERQVGLSPRDYVRQRKLERVHARLQLATARSVTEVALDHGFVHLGRFAEAYRKRFGELPSQTWKRRAPGG